jgi:hypothetical protein
MSNRTFVVDSGNTSRFVKRLFVVDSGNVSRLVIRAFVVDSGGVTRFIYSGQVFATASPTTESAGGLAPGVVTTGTTTVTATGGVPGYTYAWTWQSGGASITITSPASASTAFTAFVNHGSSFSGTALCTVTDTVGHIGTATCAVFIFAT